MPSLTDRVSVIVVITQEMAASSITWSIVYSWIHHEAVLVPATLTMCTGDVPYFKRDDDDDDQQHRLDIYIILLPNEAIHLGVPGGSDLSTGGRKRQAVQGLLDLDSVTDNILTISWGTWGTEHHRFYRGQGGLQRLHQILFHNRDIVPLYHNLEEKDPDDVADQIERLVALRRRSLHRPCYTSYVRYENTAQLLKSIETLMGRPEEVPPLSILLFIDHNHRVCGVHVTRMAGNMLHLTWLPPIRTTETTDDGEDGEVVGSHPDHRLISMSTAAQWSPDADTDPYQKPTTGVLETIRRVVLPQSTLPIGLFLDNNKQQATKRQPTIPDAFCPHVQGCMTGQCLGTMTHDPTTPTTTTTTVTYDCRRFGSMSILRFQRRMLDLICHSSSPDLIVLYDWDTPRVRRHWILHHLQNPWSSVVRLHASSECSLWLDWGWLLVQVRESMVSSTGPDLWVDPPMHQGGPEDPGQPHTVVDDGQS